MSIMEGIGCEVSHKIRAAIKAKLIELGAYVDDELPDYIMVMVANKRTRAQMDEDLQLFLASNTKIFTSWLHTVLQKLQEVTVASFENKKDSENKKSTKRKKSEDRSKKSSEEPPDKVKKHSKKHKEGKKSKKNKHKSKDKGKLKKADGKGRDEKKTSHDEDKKSKTKKLQLNEAVGRAILGNLKNKKGPSEENDSLSESSSEEDEPHVDKDADKNADKNVKEKGLVFNDYDVLNIKLDDEPGGIDMDCSKSSRKELIEDEFNIEPLKPTEKEENVMLCKENDGQSKEIESNIQIEKTISAPTKELLKEHDKIQSQQSGEEVKSPEKKKPQSDSEESLSPEEIRKQLLLSRAKKKLEESKKADRMRSYSPDVLIVTETEKPKDSLPVPRQPKIMPSRSPQPDHSKESRASSPRRRKRSPSVSSNRRTHSSDRSPYRKESKSKTNEPKSSNDDKRRGSLSKRDRKSPAEDQKHAGTSREKKKNVIKISESLELEKNMGVKKEAERQSKEKESSSRRRPVPSRVVTVVGPEEPEIPSIVKVKPREFVPKDKQANKTLLLKAVADAEKSIAAVQPRIEIEPEVKKEGLYTKNLREKRYGKLAITVSNIRQSPDSRDRRLSVNSEKSDKSRPKHDSSDVSDGMRNKSDLLSRRISKSEDQFISSKTSVMENNEKYIRCWLEGVEKAVKEDEMVNPNEMEDFVHSNYSDEENGLEKEGKGNKKRKLTEASTQLPPISEKLPEREVAVLRKAEEKSEIEPQIVVTLDGLDSKTLQDLILKNKDAVSRQMLSVNREKASREKERKGFEKINDRFGRLNKVPEEVLGKGDKKCEMDKKEKTSTESKNRQLIAQLSEKFGKVDREFENRKRKRPDDDRRYSYGSRRGGEDDAGDRNGRYRRSIREGGFRLYKRS